MLRRDNSHRQRGLSLVELMVGVAVGLFVVAGATMAVANQLGDNRRLMLETQIQQDLRAAADLIAKDLRRSGYWGEAEKSVWHASAASVDSNPYNTPPERVTLTPGAPASSVQFWYQRGAEDPSNVLHEDTERSGFRLQNGVIQMYTGGNWQALTDAATLRVTQFEVRLNTRNIDLACFKDCAGACPTQTVRDITVVIEGAAVHDAAVRRGAQSNTRLRNDVIQGACPT